MLSNFPATFSTVVTRFNSNLHVLAEQCSSIRHLKQIQAQIITQNLLGDALPVSKLLSFCSMSSSGDLVYARKVFDVFPHPNRFMYNTLIRAYATSKTNDPHEALVLYRRMIRSGILPNGFTMPFVLKSCGCEELFTDAMIVHALIFKIGLEANIFVMNSLLHAYAECGYLELAKRVFDEIPCKNSISCNSMIGGYAKIGDCGKAFGVFEMMRESGLVPDEFTISSLLSVSSQMRNFELARRVHGFVEVTGTNTDIIVGNALLDMYGKCGELGLALMCFERMPVKSVLSWTCMICAYARHGQIIVARSWFDKMTERSIASWNAMISCYLQQGLFREGLVLYDEMQTLGFMPDEVTLTSALTACSQIGDLVFGKRIHVYVCENIWNPSIMLSNSIVDMYAKCGPIDIALDIFNAMLVKDVVSWNIMIAGLAMHGRASCALDVFNRMVNLGFLPDGFTFTGLLSACSHGGLLEVGRFYFKAIKDVYGLQHEIEHYACMVDLLGRGGDLEKAVELIKSMPMKPDIVVWGALLGACKIHGNVEIANQVMKQLLELEPRGGGLYVLLSNLYYESNRLDDMKNLWKLMKGYRIEKDRASSLIEIDGTVFEFFCG